MKKVFCIFSANYLPYLGGVERYTYNLAKKLIEKGNRVIIVTSNTFQLKSYEIVDNIEVFRIPCFNILKGRFPVLKYNKEFRVIYKKLMDITFDNVIVNTRFYIHSYFGVIISKKKNINPIIIEHGTNHFTVNNPLLDFLGHIYEHIITKLIKRECNEFYGVSESCSSWLKHFGINSDGVFYNAIDNDQIKKLLMQPVVDYKSLLNIKNDGIIITYTGRLVREKGILKLIDAFRLLENEYSNIYLCIAGDGDLYEEIKKFKSNHLFVLGRIDFEHIIALLKDTDIFCLPTDYPEGFPTSVLEAASCKCFIVTTKSGGSKELIINTDHGVILNNNTPKEIYNNLKYAIDNKDYRLRAEELTYKRLNDNFTWDIVAEKVSQLK